MKKLITLLLLCFFSAAMFPDNREYNHFKNDQP